MPFPDHGLLRDGSPCRVRSLVPADAAALRALVLRQPALVRYRRFHAAVNDLTERQLAALVDDRRPGALGLGVFAGGRLIGEMRWAGAPVRAEIAGLVDVAWQRRGAATFALRALVARAAAAGLRELHATVLDSNDVVLRIARHAGWRLGRDREDGRLRTLTIPV